MSLTIVHEPADYSPVYNDMQYIVSSTQTAQQNFYVEAIIEYFDDDAADYVQEGPPLNIFPVPGTTHILCDPSRILRNKVNHDLAILMGSTTTGQRSAIGEHYRINFQEYFGSTPQASGTQINNLGYVFNASFTRRERARYNENDFVINNSQLARFLTPVDDIWVRDTDTYMLSVMSKTTGGISLFTKLRVEKFDLDGVSLGITDVSMLDPESEIRNRFQSVRCGPAQVGAAGNVQYYDIWGTNAANTQRTEKLRFHIDRTCTKYEDQTLYWVNRYGGIDMMFFPLVSRRIMDVDRKQYNRPVGTDNTTSWDLESYDAEKLSYSIKTKERMVLNTDWINDTQAIMLKDLISSGGIWWYDDENAEFVRMEMERGNYETKTGVNEGLFAEEITLVESLENVRQRC